MPKIRILSLLILIIAATAVTLPSFTQTAQAASPDSDLFFTVNAETFLVLLCYVGFKGRL